VRNTTMAIAVAFGGLSGCVRTDLGLVPYRCVHPESHRIDSERAAIVAARTAWYCARPHSQKASKEQWISGYDAVLHGEVWHVSTRVPVGFVGGGLVIYVRRSDGQIVRMELTQ